MPKSKLFHKSPQYSHLGAARTINQLQQDIHKSFADVSVDCIGMHHLLDIEKATLNSCTPFSKVFEKPDNEILSVFFRSQACSIHKYAVVCIIYHNAIESAELVDLKKKVLDEITPKLSYPPRGTTDKRKDKVTGEECNCNKGGGTKTFGCSVCPINAKKCKFYKKPLNENTGRKKFALDGKSDNINLKKCCETVCDLATSFVKKAAPQCYHNMAELAKDAKDCRIGTLDVNLFAAVTFVSDYTAHPHLDSRDFQQGAKHEQLAIIISHSYSYNLVTLQG